MTKLNDETNAEDCNATGRDGDNSKAAVDTNDNYCDCNMYIDDGDRSDEKRK